MAIIAVVRTVDPDEKYRIDIWGYQCSIADSLADQPEKNARTLTDAVSIARVINQMDRKYPILKKLMRIDDDWRAAFSKKIENKAHLAAVENEVRQMEASVETISKDLLILMQNSDLTVANKTAIVQNLHDNLDKIIKLFSNRDSMLRNYPLLAVPMLFKLTPYVPFYDKIISGGSKANMKPSDSISCRFAAIITQYYEPFLLDRLTQINIVLHHSPHEVDAQKKLIAASIKDLPYNKTGYRLKTTHKGDCSDSGCQTRMIGATETLMCWNDPIEDESDGYYSAW